MVKILVTGGGGYVGSHTVLVLLENGFDVVSIDNLVNAVGAPGGKPESLVRVEKLTGKTVTAVGVDILNTEELRNVFKTHGPFSCCIHFAALKSVGESCQYPLRYYKNNIAGSVSLLEVSFPSTVRSVKNKC